jgi:hypothetical protein
MKRNLARYAAVFVLGLGISTASQALPLIGFDAAVTVPVPTGDFSDVGKTGIGGSVEAFAGIPMLPFQFGGRVAYNHFSHKVGDGNTQIIEVLPSVRYGFGLPLGLLSFFGQFGAGAYIWNSDQKILGIKYKDNGTEFGISAGVGVTAMNFMFMPMYHLMFDDGNTSYVSLNVGMKF